MFQKIISEDAIELVEKFLFSKKTIGVLQYKCIDSYLQIENFSVHKDYRNKGYGRALIDELKRLAYICDIDWIQVYPKSVDILSDKPIPIDVLNKKYEKYGITDKEDGFNYSKPKQLMKMHIVN
jgi:GNAT superfamily N-acetyltransferase